MDSQSALALIIVSGLVCLCCGQTDAGGHHGHGYALRRSINDLDALLKVAVKGPFVVATAFNSPFRLMAANWLYAITRFGKVPPPVAVTFSDASLHDCLSLGMACYNGSNMLNGTVGNLSDHDVDYTRARVDYSKLCWGKVLFVRELLFRQYSVLLSDIDTVWVKDALRSLSMAAERNDADIVAMTDQFEGYVNSGNMLFRYNNRTLAMVDAWATYGEYGFHPGQVLPFPNQRHLWKLRGEAWRNCSSQASCAEVRRSGMAAVWLHASHGCPMTHMNYSSPDSKWTGICDTRLPYIHVVCTQGSGGKIHMSKLLRLWFVRKDAEDRHMRNARAVELWDAHREHPMQNEKLPCPNDLAFGGM